MIDTVTGTGVGEEGGGMNGLTGTGEVGAGGDTTEVGGGVGDTATGTTGAVGVITGTGVGVTLTGFFGATTVAPGFGTRNGLAGRGEGAGCDLTAGAVGLTRGVGIAKGTPRGGAMITRDGAITAVLPKDPLLTSSTAATPASAAKSTVAPAITENLPSFEPTTASGRKPSAAPRAAGATGSGAAPPGPVNRANVWSTVMVSH